MNQMRQCLWEAHTKGDIAVRDHFLWSTVSKALRLQQSWLMGSRAWLQQSRRLQFTDLKPNQKIILAHALAKAGFAHGI